MAIHVDLKMYTYKFAYYSSHSFNIIDMIFKGILLENKKFKYKALDTTELDVMDNDNYEAMKILENLITSPIEITKISDIIHERKEVSKIIFDKIINHPDIQAWLNGSELVIKFYNSFVQRSHNNTPIETSAINAEEYMGHVFRRNGLRFDIEENALIIEPPFPKDHEFYSKSVIDIFKIYKKATKYRNLYATCTNIFNPGFIDLNGLYTDSKTFVANSNIFAVMDTNFNEVPESKIGLFLAWMLYHSDRIILINIDSNYDYNKSNREQLLKNDKYHYLNNNNYSYSSLKYRLQLLYEDPFNLGKDLEYGMKFRQSILGANNPYIDICSSNLSGDVLNEYMLDLTKCIIENIHTPLKDCLNLDIYSRIYRRKNYKKIKNPSDISELDKPSEVFRALAIAFMNASKFTSELDALYRNNANMGEIIGYLDTWRDKIIIPDAPADKDNLSIIPNMPRDKILMQWH